MKCKSCMLISAIYSSLIATFIEIYGVYVLPSSASTFYLAQCYLEANIYSSPIKSIFTASSGTNCSNASTPIPLQEWEGLYSGCSCTLESEQDVPFIYASTECFGVKSCNQIYSTPSRSVYYWKNQTFCANYYATDDGFEFKETAVSNCSDPSLKDCGLTCVFQNSSCPVKSLSLVSPKSSQDSFSINTEQTSLASDDILLSLKISYDPAPCISPSLSQLRPNNQYFTLEVIPDGCMFTGEDNNFSQKIDNISESDLWTSMIHPPTTTGFDLFQEFAKNLSNSVSIFSRSRVKFKTSPECSSMPLVPSTSLVGEIDNIRVYLKISLWCGVFLIVTAIGSSDRTIRNNNALSCFNYAAVLFYLASFFRVSHLFKALLNISDVRNGFFGIAFQNCIADDNYNWITGQLVGSYISYYGGLLSLDIVNVFCGFVFIFVSFNILITKIQGRFNIFEEVKNYFQRRRQNYQGLNEAEEGIEINMANFENHE